MTKELPELVFFTITRYKGEFAIIQLRMRGDEVLSREVLEMDRQFSVVWSAYREFSEAKFNRKGVC